MTEPNVTLEAVTMVVTFAFVFTVLYLLIRYGEKLAERRDRQE